jgi:hypothetical protein
MSTTPTTFHDLAEHTGTLISLLGLVAGIAGLLFWRMFVRIESKIDQFLKWITDFIEKCAACQIKQKEDFVDKKSFEVWQDGRNGPGGLWEVINHHSHDPKGRVTRI